MLPRCDVPALRELQRAIGDFEDVLARVLKVGGAQLDDLRENLPDKNTWLAGRADPPTTLSLRSEKREFLLRIGGLLRALGCTPSTVPRLDASIFAASATERSLRRTTTTTICGSQIANRPPFVTTAKYDVRHQTFPPAWTVSFDEDPDLADEEMRSMGDVAVKVTLYSDDGRAFVGFKTWLSQALAEHYGDDPPPDVGEALRVLKSR